MMFHLFKAYLKIWEKQQNIQYYEYESYSTSKYEIIWYKSVLNEVDWCPEVFLWLVMSGEQQKRICTYFPKGTFAYHVEISVRVA